jgi:hypothetical protein
MSSDSIHDAVLCAERRARTPARSIDAATVEGSRYGCGCRLANGIYRHITEMNQESRNRGAGSDEMHGTAARLAESGSGELRMKPGGQEGNVTILCAVLFSFLLDSWFPDCAVCLVPCCPFSEPANLGFTMKNRHTDNCEGCGGSVRALAASAGIQFGDLQAEVYRLRDKLGPDRKKAYDESIRQLARGGAVSEAEQRALLELSRRCFAVVSNAQFEKFAAYSLVASPLTAYRSHRIFAQLQKQTAEPFRDSAVC